MMGALPDNVDKIARLIRLMGSHTPGEQIAAVEGLRRVLQAQSLDFNDLAAWIERMATQDAAEQVDDWMKVATTYLRQGEGVLAERDMAFLRNVAAMAARGRPPSEGQQKWLYDISRKLEAARVRGGRARRHAS